MSQTDRTQHLRCAVEVMRITIETHQRMRNLAKREGIIIDDFDDLHQRWSFTLYTELASLRKRSEVFLDELGEVDIVSKAKHYEQECKRLTDALDRSPYDIGPCVCGKPVVHLPEGLTPLCVACAEKMGEQ